MSSSTTSPMQPFPDSKLTEAEIPLIEVRLEAGGKILVEEDRAQDTLRTKGFGDREDVEYILKPYEALYLVYAKRLTFKDKIEMTFDSLFEMLLKYDKNIMTKFLVYRDLRSRGYVAKEGFGFGNDFRVYERGEYEKKPAKYVIFGINEGTNTSAKNFSKAIGQIEKMGKEAVVAVIERRGEVIYYKASKMRFIENKHQQNNA
ncbi:MAG TPA: tRNA-intron lyase [Nitrososphaera sp.]|nr:tRNA-intron lyase [Nitrososphaera sp.]